MFLQSGGEGVATTAIGGEIQRICRRRVQHRLKRSAPRIGDRGRGQAGLFISVKRAFDGQVRAADWRVIGRTLIFLDADTGV